MQQTTIEFIRSKDKRIVQYSMPVNRKSSANRAFNFGTKSHDVNSIANEQRVTTAILFSTEFSPVSALSKLLSGDLQGSVIFKSKEQGATVLQRLVCDILPEHLLSRRQRKTKTLRGFCTPSTLCTVAFWRSPFVANKHKKERRKKCQLIQLVMHIFLYLIFLGF